VYHLVHLQVVSVRRGPPIEEHRLRTANEFLKDFIGSSPGLNGRNIRAFSRKDRCKPQT